MNRLHSDHDPQPWSIVAFVDLRRVIVSTPSEIVDHDPQSWSIVEFVDIRRVIVSAPSEFPWMQAFHPSDTQRLRRWISSAEKPLWYIADASPAFHECNVKSAGSA